MNNIVREGELRRRVHFISSLSLGEVLLGVSLYGIQSLGDRWTNRCIQDVAGRSIPPDEVDKARFFDSIKIQNPNTIKSEIEKMTNERMGLEIKRWNYAQKYCREEGMRRALAF